MHPADPLVTQATHRDTDSYARTVHPEDCICPRCPFGHAMRLECARPWIASGMNGFPSWARMVQGWSDANIKLIMQEHAYSTSTWNRTEGQLIRESNNSTLW